MYLVLEVQGSNEHVGTLAYEFESDEDAKAKYHTILAVAAKSSVLHHGAVLLMDSRVMAAESFDHFSEEEQFV